MTEAKDVIWTLKVSKRMDDAVQEMMDQLGYKSKAELAREAIRDFMLRRNMYFLLGGEIQPPSKSEITPENALSNLHKILAKIPKQTIAEEVQKAREDVERLLFGSDQESK